MCGLCGSFTAAGVQLNKGRRLQRGRALEALLIANQVRGTDSTGMAAIGHDGKYNLLKAVGEPWDFVKRNDAQALLRTDAPIMIGHTRMTSMGNDVTDENAHPFVEGNIIGAHNGIINNYLQLDSTVNVDSQAVFRMLDAHHDVYDYVFERVSGSCTLTWWDARDPAAMYIVAHQNPLNVAIIPAIETIFWSSQAEHLEPIMHGVYGHEAQFVEVKKDTVYRLDATDIWGWQEMKVSFREGYYSSPSQYAPYNHGGTSYREWIDEDEFFQSYYGLSAAEVGDKIPQLTGGDADPKEQRASVTSKPDNVIHDDTDRYEEYWDRLMGDGSQSESESDSSDSVDENARLLSLTDEQHKQLELREVSRMTITDASGELMCGYCDKPIGESGEFDAGLDMILCKPCQRWWDNYGSKTSEGTALEVLAQTPATYQEAQA